MPALDGSCAQGAFGRAGFASFPGLLTCAQLPPSRLAARGRHPILEASLCSKSHQPPGNRSGIPLRTRFQKAQRRRRACPQLPLPIVSRHQGHTAHPQRFIHRQPSDHHRRPDGVPGRNPGLRRCDGSSVGGSFGRWGSECVVGDFQQHHVGGDYGQSGVGSD